MAIRFGSRVMSVSIALVCLMSCDSRGSASLPGFVQYVSDLETIGAAIAGATGNRAERVHVTGNRTSLHISIFDPKMMEADAATIDVAASAAVAAAEPALAAHPEFEGVQAISVGIHHPSGLAAPVRAWHSEDVVEFHRGPDRHFARDVP
jgi:hypothetical protein